MELTGGELRVLGCLIEKSHTTPDQYPLSTNALRVACNQKTSRQPVVNYTAQEVDAIILELRERKFARSVHGKGSRGYKHRHVIDERLGLDNGHQAVLAVLMLRGPQSEGELASRTERYLGVASAGGVASILSTLASQGLAHNVGRVAGQSQDRWLHQLSPADAPQVSSEPVQLQPPQQTPGLDQNLKNQRSNEPGDQLVVELTERIVELEQRVAVLEQGQT